MLIPTHRAAGIAFVTPDRSALFLKRGPGGDYAGYWCFPGGHVEDGETTEAAAKREAVEEIGSLPKGKREIAARSILAQEITAPAVGDAGAIGVDALPMPVAPVPKVVDYTTFIQEVSAPFEPERDAEHVGHAWAPLNSPPEPLHPGVRIAIDRMLADELGIARMIASGSVTSPQRYHNVTLWAMRITGTGVSYRRPVFDVDAEGIVVLDADGKPSLLREEEFPWRDPAIYLNEEFLARCNGLPVIWKHPKGATLDSKEYERRNVGTIFLPFIRGDEVWGVAKVFDDDANEALAAGAVDGKDWSTSPAVVLSDPNNPSYKFRLEDGSLLLVEGKPSLLDHLAICERGVWDKGGEPAGIINDSVDIADDGIASLLHNLSWLDYGVQTLEMRVDSLNRRMHR